MNVSLVAILNGLQPSSTLVLGDYKLRRTQAYWSVSTPLGTRRVTTVEQALILLRGEWFCNKCGRVLPLRCFADDSARGGRRTGVECKDCEAMRNSVWFQNKKKDKTFRRARALYARAWRRNNQVRYNAAQRRWRLVRSWNRKAS